MGLAFAFGWTPCIGPILGPILALAGTKKTIVEGGVLLAVYGAGLGIPFLLAAVFLRQFMYLFNYFRHYLGLVEKTMGALLVIVGIVFLSGGMQTNGVLAAGILSYSWNHRVITRCFSSVLDPNLYWIFMSRNLPYDYFWLQVKASECILASQKYYTKLEIYRSLIMFCVPLSVLIGEGRYLRSLLVSKQRWSANRWKKNRELNFLLRTSHLAPPTQYFAAREAIANGYDDILVLYGDTPLIRPETLADLRQSIIDGVSSCRTGISDQKSR